MFKNVSYCLDVSRCANIYIQACDFVTGLLKWLSCQDDYSPELK